MFDKAEAVKGIRKVHCFVVESGESPEDDEVKLFQTTDDYNNITPPDLSDDTDSESEGSVSPDEWDGDEVFYDSEPDVAPLSQVVEDEDLATPLEDSDTETDVAPLSQVVEDEDQATPQDPETDSDSDYQPQPTLKRKKGNSLQVDMFKSRKRSLDDLTDDLDDESADSDKEAPILSRISQELHTAFPEVDHPSINDTPPIL